LVPRLVFSFFDTRAQSEDDDSVVGTIFKRTFSSCSRCYQEWMQNVTHYAFVNVAAEGVQFSTAVEGVRLTFATHRRMLRMERWTCACLRGISCILVPLVLIVALWFTGLPGLAFDACAPVVALLATISARFSLGVFDACVTALLFCLARDREHCDCDHMGRSHVSATLKEAFEL
jgi:hypothetical protein